MKAFPRESLTKKGSLVAAGISFILLLVLIMSVFGGHQGATDSYSVAAPSEGFDWHFDEGLRVTHTGSGSIPDTTGNLQAVEIVEIEYTKGIGTAQECTVTTDLYLTPDFRFVVFRDSQFGGGTNMRSFAWTAEPVPWLFGASEWFGAHIEERSGVHHVQWHNSSKGERVDDVDVSIHEGILSVEQQQPFQYSDPPGYANPHEVTILGDFYFEAGTSTPYKMSAPKTGDQQKRDFVLAEQESIVLDRPSVGRPIDDVPAVVDSTGFVPIHSSDWNHPFPFQEAWQVLKGEETVPDGHFITSISGGNPDPNEAWVGGTAVNITLDRQWTWDITVDSPTDAPKTYRVSKIEHAPMGSSNYSYRVEEWNRDIPNVSTIELAEKTIPIDLLIDFVEQKTGGEFHSMSTIPYVEDGRLIGQSIGVSLRPADGGHVRYLPHLYFDAQNGNMTQGTLPPDYLKTLLFDAT